MHPFKKMIYMLRRESVPEPPVAAILSSEDNSAMCYGQYFVRINTSIPLLVNIIATFANGGSYLSEDFLTGGNKKTANVINEEITGMTFYSFGINGANSGSILNNSSITVTITSVDTGTVLSSHTFNRLHADTPC